ncbi:protein ABHD11-like [Uloborus diversus]|uniref:protein ABHD11-like n=1 Tax=Uloborus diversus TaxID=327109 RepID=UPI0024092EF1|nr:protein ABHD11-like [Uloborus diversus]
MNVSSYLQSFGRNIFLKENISKLIHNKFISTSISNPRFKSVKLSYSIFTPEEKPVSDPVIILHGLLGSKQNWRGLAKSIARSSRCDVYALDARNHGDSPHSEQFSYRLMADDVKQFMKSQEISQAVLIGHSMGGRTAMTVALSEKGLVKKLVIVDVSPKKMPRSASAFIPSYMTTMKAAIASIPSVGLVQARKMVDDYLSKYIPEFGIRQFLLTNLVEKDNHIQWKPNIDVLQDKFEQEIIEFPDLSETFTEDTLFICGGDSPYVKEQDYPYIRKLFPKAQFVVIPGAGHWVHSEKPAEFLDTVRNFL